MKTVNKLSEHDGLLYAKRISAEGHAIDLDLDDPEAHKCGAGLLWLHMCALNPDTREFLHNETDLDELVINALLAEETRPRILVRQEGVMVILRAMNLHKGCDPEDMISLRVWTDGERIITTRRRDILSIEDVKRAIANNKGPKTTGEFLTMITGCVYARMEPHIEDLEERAAKVEELVALCDIDEATEDSGLIRIRTAVFRRYIVPQRNVLEQLINARFSWLSEQDIEQLVESHDRVMRYVETLNDIRDRAQIVNDEITKIHDAKLNSTAYIFSVAATIFLPLSFLTGLMGINIGGMPGIDDDAAFWVFSGFCLIIVVTQIILFKKIKWF